MHAEVLEGEMQQCLQLTLKCIKHNKMDGKKNKRTYTKESNSGIQVNEYWGVDCIVF